MASGSIPVDIKDILNASSEASKAQSEAVKVDVYVDLSASEQLVSAVKQAFTPQAANAYLHIEAFDDSTVELPQISRDTDLVVIIAGTSITATRLANHAHNLKVPTLTVAMTLSDALANSTASGFPLVAADTIPFMQANETAEDAVEDFLPNVGQWIVDRCSAKRLAFANAFAFIRKPLALEITKNTSFQNGALGAVLFIPGADMPVMTANQIKMILQIAAAYGQKIGLERAKELAVVVGGGFAFRTIARELVALIPAYGWAVKAGVGYSGTFAMGRAAIEYFESGGTVAGVGEKVVSARNKVMEKAREAKSSYDEHRQERAKLSAASKQEKAESKQAKAESKQQAKQEKASKAQDAPKKGFTSPARRHAKRVVSEDAPRRFPLRGFPLHRDGKATDDPILVEPLEVTTVDREGGDQE